MSRVNMTARHFHRLRAAIFLIIINLAPHQAVQSAESGLSNFGSASVPAKEFQALATSSQYSDVLRSAYRILDRGSEYEAETGESLVEPLMKHALVRQQAGENLQAEQAAELAIELIERNGGVFDPGLVEPLVFLAQLRQDGGDYPAAMERLYRAQHILHRTDGVMTGLQLPILALMNTSFAAMDQDDEVRLLTELAYVINVRRLDKNSLEFVPFILDQAEFKARIWQFRAAREMYADALEILEQSLPKNDSGFVAALNGLASVRYKEQKYGVPSSRLIARGKASTIQTTKAEDRSTLHIGRARMLDKGPKTSPYNGRKEGTRTLQTVIVIMEEHPQSFSTVQRAEAQIRLGDWFMLIRKPRLADDAYRNAWQILAAEEDATKLLASYFGQPKKLKYSKPSLPREGPGRYANYDDRYVAVRFSVNENGAVRNLRFVGSNSPAALNLKMRDAVKRAIYRPRYIDAQAVVTDDCYLREEFTGTAYTRHLRASE
ncbi:MAG: tetratricopeptide repeat protein [Proteobacteria bacterium]|nr:tetratricopeptide repeat protein [Pseudomonadota bacterium]